MFKSQEYLQNKYKSIYLFQHQMFVLFQVALHPIRDQKDDGYHVFFILLKKIMKCT